MTTSTRRQEEKDEMKYLIEQVMKLSTNVTCLRNQNHQLLNAQRNYQSYQGNNQGYQGNPLHITIEIKHTIKDFIKAIKDIKAITKVIKRIILDIVITTKGTKEDHGTPIQITEAYLHHWTILHLLRIDQLIKFS